MAEKSSYTVYSGSVLTVPVQSIEHYHTTQHHGFRREKIPYIRGTIVPSQVVLNGKTPKRLEELSENLEFEVCVGGVAEGKIERIVQAAARKRANNFLHNG